MVRGNKDGKLPEPSFQVGIGSEHAWLSSRAAVSSGPATGFAVMAPASLHTAVSRWENGHVIPDQAEKLPTAHDGRNACLAARPKGPVVCMQSRRRSTTDTARTQTGQLQPQSTADGRKFAVKLSPPDSIRTISGSMPSECRLTCSFAPAQCCFEPT